MEFNLLNPSQSLVGVGSRFWRILLWAVVAAGLRRWSAWSCVLEPEGPCLRRVLMSEKPRLRLKVFLVSQVKRKC